MDEKMLSEKMRRTIVMDNKTKAILWILIKERFNSLPKNSVAELDREDLIKLCLNLGFYEEADTLIEKT